MNSSYYFVFIEH